MNRRNFVSLAGIFAGGKVARFNIAPLQLGATTETNLSLRSSTMGSNAIAHAGFTSEFRGAVVVSDRTGNIRAERIFEPGATTYFTSITGGTPFYISGIVQREDQWSGLAKVFSLENGQLEEVVEFDEAQPGNPPLISQHSDMLITAWNKNYPEVYSSQIARVDRDTGGTHWQDRIADSAIVGLTPKERGVDVAVRDADEVTFREYAPDGSTRTVGQLSFAVSAAARGERNLVVAGLAKSNESKFRPTIMQLTNDGRTAWQVEIPRAFDRHDFEFTDIAYNSETGQFVLCGVGEQSQGVVSLVARINEDGTGLEIRDIATNGAVYIPRAVTARDDNSFIMSGERKKISKNNGSNNYWEGVRGWVFHLQNDFWQDTRQATHTPTQSSRARTQTDQMVTQTERPSSSAPETDPAPNNPTQTTGEGSGFGIGSILAAIFLFGYLIKRRLK